MPRQLADFIEKANLVHRNKFDYSLIDQDNFESAYRIPIICPTHGRFEAIKWRHIKGSNCPECERELKRKRNQQRSTAFDVFVKRAQAKHNNRYYYPAEPNKGFETRRTVVVVCQTHGEFTTLKHNHLRGAGCKKCSNEQNQARAIIRANNEIETKRSKRYTFPSGKIVFVQGYEPYALDLLLAGGVPEQLIQVTNRKAIAYMFEHTHHLYIPDIIVKNRVIEVKSRYTFEKSKMRNEAKARAAIAAGFDFEFWIFEKDMSLTVYRPDHHTQEPKPPNL